MGTRRALVTHAAAIDIASGVNDVDGSVCSVDTFPLESQVSTDATDLQTVGRTN